MKTPLTGTTVRLCAALAAFAAVAVWADGELDNAFGTSGATQITFPNSMRGYLHSAQTLANGTIEAAGFAKSPGLPTATTPAPDFFIAKLSSTGVLTSAQTFSQAAIKSAINGPAGAVIEPRNGNLFVVGSNAGSTGLLSATVYWLDAAGKVRGSYSRPATGPADQSACLGRPILDNQGGLVASCIYGDTSGILQLVALRLIPRTTTSRGTTTYRLVSDATFGANGFSIIATFPVGYTFAGATSITQDSNTGDYYLGGFACSGNCLGATSNRAVAQVVVRLNGISGALDTTYGTGGFAVAFAPQATGGSPEALTLDNAGKVVIGGNYSTAGATQGTGYVSRLVANGTPDAGFGTNGTVLGIAGNEVIDVRTDATNKVYALDHGSHLLRLTNSGLVDSTFAASGSDVQTLNGAGSVWQSMQFVDGSQSSALLAGGVSAACTMSCAVTAVVAKVALVTASMATTTSLTPAPTPNPSVLGDAVYFWASVSGAGSVVPTGTVTFMDGTVTLETATLANGIATIANNSLTVGYHNITAGYSGDANHAPSSSPSLTVTVNATARVPTTMALNLLPATSSVGQLVTMTATVTGSNPTGTVTFSEGADILGTALLAGGAATVTTDVLNVGTHPIMATYNGDATYVGSSAVATETVSMAAPTVALTVTPATITEGQTVTLTASVAGVAGLTPTGAVTFKDGTTALGMAVTLQPDGTASISTAMLAVGNHSLTAEYGGDTNYGPEISLAVMEMVNAKPVPPSASGGGGGGGGLGLLDLCALLLLVAARIVPGPKPALPQSRPN